MVVERHVLASPRERRAESWRTYGATPGLHDKIGDPLHQVPWPIGFQTLEEPAFLGGISTQRLLDPKNYDRLGFSHNITSQHHLFSMSGVLGESRGAAGQWRVITHTFVLDASAWEVVAGNPEGLLRIGRLRAATGDPPWLRHFVSGDFAEPEDLEPIRLDGLAPEVFEQDRTAAVTRLRHSLSERGLDTARLIGWLAMIHEALADACGDADRNTHVVLPKDGKLEEMLAHLAWLTLPCRDRSRVTFGTHVRPERMPRLSVIARRDMPHSRPRDWIVLDSIRTFDSQEFRGRRVWVGWEMGASLQRNAPNGKALNLEIQKVSILRAADARYVASLPEYLQWHEAFRDNPDLGTVRDGIRLAAKAGLEREVVVARLASAAVSAVIPRTRHDSPEQIAEELLDAVDGGVGDYPASVAELQERIVSGILDLLKGRSESAPLSLGGAILCLGSMRERVGLTLGDVARLAESERVMAGQLTRTVGGARLLLQAAESAWDAGQLGRAQAENLIRQAFGKRHGRELKNIIPLPDSVVESSRSFAWWLLLLRAGSGSGVPSAHIGEVLRVAIIPFLLREPRQGHLVAEDATLCRLTLEVAAPEDRASLLQSLDPPADLLAELLTRGEFEDWIPSLVEAGCDPQELDEALGRKAVGPVERVRLLGDEEWRIHSGRDRSYRRAAALIRETPHRMIRDVAHEIVKNRTANPQSMGAGERLLVSSAIETLAASDGLDGTQALALVELARRTPGSSLAWMTSCNRAWDQPDSQKREALLALGRVIAEEVRRGVGAGPEDLLRAAWIQVRSIGRPALLQDGPPLPDDVLVAMLIVTPPLPLYLLIRQRLHHKTLPHPGRRAARRLWSSAPDVAKRLGQTGTRSEQSAGFVWRIFSVFRRNPARG